MQILSGAELVLVARIPKGGDRWQQVHFNRDVAEQFFRVDPGSPLHLRLERIDLNGEVINTSKKPLVFSDVNRNCKVELEFSTAEIDRPEPGPLVVMVELGVRSMRYLTILHGERGYGEMDSLVETLPTVGRGVRRVLTFLDDVELRWPACPLRGR